MDSKDLLVDVDALVSRCRDEKTKPLLAEAVACYQAGAFRAAVVATWIAVVFDFLAKLRELELTGDKQAIAYLAQFERVHQEKDPQKAIRQAQDLERTMLDTARNDFELLSPLQYKDLLRIYEDRHRCAHPSMHSLEEPYQPTRTLVLCHLENAVTFLLERPPVQGKAAEDRIWADIHSEYFPTTVEEAMNHFTSGPLARVREPLLRRVIVGLTRDLLTKQRPPIERQRQFAALGAALQLSYQKDERILRGMEILNTEFASIVFPLPDEAWPVIISYLHHIPSAWNSLSEVERRKAFRFVQSCPLEIVEQIMAEALTITALKEMARERLCELSIDSLSSLLSQSKQPELIEEAIQRWGNVSSYAEAKVRTKNLIIPLIPVLLGKQIIQIVTLFQNNNELYNSFFTRDIMLDIFKHSSQYAEETKDAWMQLYEEFCMVSQQGELILQKNPSLLSLIEDTYPNNIDPILAQARKQYIQQREHENPFDDDELGTL